MRKYFSKIAICISFVLSFFGFISCTEYLDKAPLSDIKDNDAYKNFRNFQGFTEELYGCIPLLTENGSHSAWNFGDDEIWELKETRLFNYDINQGNYWNWTGTVFNNWFKTGGKPETQVKGDKGNLWGLAWYGIRKANIGIANLDKLTEASDEEKKLIAGQLYFFRGVFHFMLMEYWGGLPYINTVLPSDQVIRIPRLNYQATADSVAKDLQKAADLLPMDWDSTKVGYTYSKGNNNLRINKIMALAYLGKNYLWAGSPLMNKASGGTATYNTEYCKKAADVLGQVLSLCETTKRYELASFANYSSIFYTYKQGGKIPGLKEAIFMESLAEVGGRWRWNQVNDYRPAIINNSGIKCWPSARYVDYFGMANGLPITDPASGYDPEHPWKNRDPRFYTDIIYDGVKCTLNSKGTDAHTKQYASLYTGGPYRVWTANGDKAAFTGYMNCKWTSQFTNDADGYLDNNVVVLSLLRLADVYLLYAEATLQGYGSAVSSATGYSLTAEGAINAIRDRAGVGHVDAKFVGDKELFMSEIRRERAVELAFEGHRFTDLRRWMLLLDKPYTLFTAVEYDRAGGTANDPVLYANPQNGRVLNIRQTTLFERHLSEKHYWFPFLKSDVNMYKEFTQNPGW